MSRQHTLQERIISFAQDAAQHWEQWSRDPNKWYCTKHNTIFLIPDEPCWGCYNENELWEVD